MYSGGQDYTKGSQCYQVRPGCIEQLSDIHGSVLVPGVWLKFFLLKISIGQVGMKDIEKISFIQQVNAVYLLLLLYYLALG